MKTKVARSKKNIHVLPLGNGWAVRTANSGKFIVITSTKSEAVTAGRTIAQTNHGSLIIHGKDGRITARNSYARKTSYPLSHSHSRAGEAQPASYGSSSRLRKKK